MLYTVRQYEEDRHKSDVWFTGMTSPDEHTPEQRALLRRASPSDVEILYEAASNWDNTSMLRVVSGLATRTALQANSRGESEWYVSAFERLAQNAISRANELDERRSVN